MSKVAAVESMTISQLSEFTQQRKDVVTSVARDLTGKGLLNPWYVDGEGHFDRLDSILLVARLSPEFSHALVRRWDELERERLAPPPQPQAHITTDQIAQALGVKPSPSFLNNAGIGRTCLRDLDLHNHYERQPDGSTKFSLVGALVVGLCHSRKVAFTDALHHLKVQAEAPRLQQATNPKLGGLHGDL